MSDPYKILGVPHICMKVPTGGGKTFIACSAVKHIFQHMPLDKPKVVLIMDLLEVNWVKC